LGGTRGLAERIVAEVLGPDGRAPAFFCEPFCGSMAVSLAMPAVATHVVNDLHADLVNFARVLASDGLWQRMVSKAERTLSCEQLYRDAHADMMWCTRPTQVTGEVAEGLYQRCEDERKLRWAWAFFVLSWLGPNGMAGTEHAARFCVRWGPGGGDPATRLRSAAEALPGFVEKLRRFTITSRDGLEVIGSVQDKPGVALYVDPPYTRETRVAGAYRHDFEDHGGATLLGAEDDHDRLAAALRRFKHARVVVSYEDCPRVRELYAGWRVVEVTQHKNTGNAGGGGGGGGSSAPEILLVNGGGA
jgi:DNA adenine methylase